MSIGPAEILVIMVVALLVFGPQRLPEVGRQIGAAMRELRRMQDTVRGELDMVLNPEHGTSPRDAPPLEPADHSAIDQALTDSSGDVTSMEIAPPGVTSSEISQPDADTDTEPGGRFSGPPDSFL